MLTPAMLRPMEPTDYAELATLFAGTIRHHGPEHYTPAQVEAWAAGAHHSHFVQELAFSHGWVAWHGEQRVGFVTLDDSGHLGLLYVAAGKVRGGIGQALLERAMLQARELGMSRLEVEASAFSLGLFLKLGFTLIGVERVERGGVAFERHRLERLL